MFPSCKCVVGSGFIPRARLFLHDDVRLQENTACIAAKAGTANSVIPSSPHQPLFSSFTASRPFLLSSSFPVTTTGSHYLSKPHDSSSSPNFILRLTSLLRYTCASVYHEFMPFFNVLSIPASHFPLLLYLLPSRSPKVQRNTSQLLQ